MAAKSAKPKEKKIGTIEHYYPKVHAASVGLEGDLKLGDTVHIQGHGDDLREKVTSMQIDHVPIQEGHAGQHIGLQVPKKVHKKADVFKVEPGTPAPKAKKAPAKQAAKKAPRKAAKASKAPRRKKSANKKAAKKAKKAGKRKAPKRAKGKRKAAKGKRTVARKAGRKKR